MKQPASCSAMLVLALGLVACGGGGPGANNANPSGTVLPTTLVAIPSASYTAGSVERGGWTVLQQARGLCGFGVQAQNSQLDAAAQSHARYQNSISLASGVSELTHYESITTDRYYTGYSPWDRTVAQGYGNRVAEILEATVWDYDISNPPVFPTLEQRGANSMRSLLNTVYHLIGAMYDGAEVGFGADLQTRMMGTARHEEYRFGSLNGYQNSVVPLGRGTVVTYPCQGSTDIAPSFVPANERPNPFPDMTSILQTVGPPIYLKADAGQVLSINASSSVVSESGQNIPVVLLNNSNDPQVPKEIGRHEAFVVPANALTPHTTYQVNLSGTLNGVPFSRSFAMSTGAV